MPACALMQMIIAEQIWLRPGLLFSLVWPVVWQEQWMWVYAKIKDWSDCINRCPTILNAVMILCHLWTPSLLSVPQFAVKIVRVISKHFQARLNDWQTLWWRAQRRCSTKLTGGVCSPPSPEPRIPSKDNEEQTWCSASLAFVGQPRLVSCRARTALEGLAGWICFASHLLLHRNSIWKKFRAGFNHFKTCVLCITLKASTHL